MQSTKLKNYYCVIKESRLFLEHENFERNFEIWSWKIWQKYSSISLAIACELKQPNHSPSRTKQAQQNFFKTAKLNILLTIHKGLHLILWSFQPKALSKLIEVTITYYKVEGSNIFPRNRVNRKKYKRK